MKLVKRRHILGSKQKVSKTFPQPANFNVVPFIWKLTKILTIGTNKKRFYRHVFGFFKLENFRKFNVTNIWNQTKQNLILLLSGNKKKLTNKNLYYAIFGVRLKMKNLDNGTCVDDDNHASSTNELPSNHLTNVESSGIVRNRMKRFAQPRIIRVRASSSSFESSSSLSSSPKSDVTSSLSYDSATLSGTGGVDVANTKKRKIKGFRFDSTTLPGSKKI